MYVSMKEMLEKAKQENYAVMAINCFNLETARTVITAAELENAPIIINIFEAHLINHCHSDLIVPIVKNLANKTNIKVALNLDHGKNEDFLIKAIHDGFSSVMIDASLLDLDFNINKTKKLVKLAHKNGISVEGELGAIGNTTSNGYTNVEMMTKSKDAIRFVTETKIDALAISIGTSHGNYPEGIYPKFDFERLKEIKSLIDIPLVLHGGSGSGKENIQKAISLGINKINVGCDFFNSCTLSIKNQLKKNIDINYYDLIHQVEIDSIEKIREYIKLSGSTNKN